MIELAIYNKENGAIRGFVYCGCAEVESVIGETEEFFLNCPKEATHIVDGEPVKSAPSPAPKLSYREMRQRAYPPIGDQLDAIWKGGEAMEQMRALILTVKERYPKADSELA